MEDPEWLTREQLAVWVRLNAVVEMLPGVLDSQLRRDAQLTHFDYFVLAQLSEEPGQTLRMTALAARATATLARLSHVVQRLEARGLLERFPCPEDKRATNVHLTASGLQKVKDSAAGHVGTVRRYVIDAVTQEQLRQLGSVADAILARLDPEGVQSEIYRRYDDR